MPAQKQNTVFQMIAASSGKTVPLSGGGEPRQLRVGLVSAPYFDIFGVRPSLGRSFANGEDLPGKDRVAVLSHRIWQSSFGSDAGILGRDLTLDGESYTIIGVLPGDNEFDRGCYAQSPIVGVSLLAKGAGGPSMLIKSIQQSIWRINKNQALPDAGGWNRSRPNP